MNKIIKNYFILGIISAIIFSGLTLFLVTIVIKDNLSSGYYIRASMVLVLSLAGMFLSGMISYSNLLGKPLKRNDLKNGINFHLEKIQGVGNESLYFIYKDSKKFLYTDITSFENGEYIKISGSLFKIENFSYSRE